MSLDTGTHFQGTHELLRIRFLANADPHVDTINFNAALASAKRKNTLDNEEIKGLSIDTLDKVFYAAVVNRRMLTDHRAVVDLNMIQLWTQQCYASNAKAGVTNGFSAAKLTEDPEENSAIADLTSILSSTSIKRQVKTLSGRMDDMKGFTPRPSTRSAWPSTRAPAANKRDEFGSHKFNVSEFENDHYAKQFQCAMENDDSERFNALCFLAGGEPEMCDELSAYSFGTSPPVVRLQHSVSVLLTGQPVDTSMGGFHVGGAAGDAPSFATVNKINGAHVGTTETPPQPPLSDDGTDGTADDRVYPAAGTVHFENQTFADIIARGSLAVQHDELHLRHAWMIDDDGDNNSLLNDSESDEEDASETVSNARRSVVPRHGVCRRVAVYHPPSAQR
ncbi:hypothetical protein CYMTET_13814 [Cymbomonas tetramitiformis]|uniref:Uncharacterized protein n=1 Tax=Cymbomonas tetramitiformis TaxID=36881 RepID=A0AAE0GHM1_9CHLO|nr:hypothetical protein CYMTET_13814 [Cymbomonas tetramitiformis]